MRTASIYRVFYRDALAKVRAARAEYDAEVAEWYATGDGATRGYSFPHCIHGTSRWTDYDNICGGCEDSLTDLQEASGIARQAWVRFYTRWDWVMAAPADLQHQQPEAYDALREWAFSLFPGYSK